MKAYRKIEPLAIRAASQANPAASVRELAEAMGFTYAGLRKAMTYNNAVRRAVEAHKATPEYQRALHTKRHPQTAGKRLSLEKPLEWYERVIVNRDAMCEMLRAMIRTAAQDLCDIEHAASAREYFASDFHRRVCVDVLHVPVLRPEDIRIEVLGRRRPDAD